MTETTNYRTIPEPVCNPIKLLSTEQQFNALPAEDQVSLLKFLIDASQRGLFIRIETRKREGEEGQRLHTLWRNTDLNPLHKDSRPAIHVLNIIMRRHENPYLGDLKY